jgi:hypothetical protein
MLQSRPSSNLLSNMDVPSLSHHLVIRTHRPHSPRNEFARLMDFVVGRFSGTLALRIRFLGEGKQQRGFSHREGGIAI